MIKNIKRVGIIFLAIAIICLMVIGCCLAFSVKTESKYNTGLESGDNDWQTVVDIPEVSEADTIRLNQATDDEMTQAFRDALTKSATEFKTVKIVLEKDWNCPKNFIIDYNMKIVLDLNGHKMDASNTKEYISIIYNYGSLFITDSVYVNNAEAIKASVNAIYDRRDKGTIDDTQVATELNNINCGKITGGYTDSGYGAIVNSSRKTFGASENSTFYAGGNLYIFGGLFCNSSSGCGGAFYTYNEATLHFYDGIVANNKSTEFVGGGIANAGHLLMKGGLIIGNHATATRGGGIALYQRDYSLGFSVIEDVELRSNHSFASGAGIAVNDSLAQLTRVKFKNNIAGYDNNYQSENNNGVAGGGIWINGGVTSLVMKYCEFYGNEQNYGGAVYLSNGAIPTYIDNCIIKDTTSYRHCGGIYVTSSSIAYVSNTTIENNQVVYGQSIGAGGLQVYGTASVYGKNLTIKNNKVLGSNGGGGIFVGDACRFYLSGANDISGNTIKDGVASDIYLDKMKMYITGEISLKSTADGGSGKPMVIEECAKTSKFDTFTWGYSKFVNGIDPSTLFTNVNGAKAVLKNDEVCFDYSVNSEYDFTYLDNGIRKYYKDTDKLFGYNDSAIKSKVLGKILPNTSVNEFIANIEPFGFENMKLFNCEGVQVFGNGSDSKYANMLDNGEELAVGTDWYMTCTLNGVNQTIYLSVLGDINGDGKINSADVTLVNKIAIGEVDFGSLSLTQRLASLIINKNNVTTIDSRVIWEVTCGKVDIRDFI